VIRTPLGRLLVALAVGLGLLVLTPTPSWACSCAAADTAQHVREATTVAAGSVYWSATDGQTRTYDVHVDAVYKGAAADSEKVRTSAYDASCGLGDLATDRRYLFFIEGRHPGAMRVGLCGGTVPFDASVAAEVEAVTGPPGKPLATQPREHPRPAGRGGPGVVPLLGLAAVAVAGVLVVVVRRRRTG
jgi:hypothetical protein